MFSRTSGMLANAASIFIQSNKRISDGIDAVSGKWFGRRFGNAEFANKTLHELLQPGQRVLDVGGGKRPQIDAQTKKELALTVAGLDISMEELAQAPLGSYDQVVVGDVADVALPDAYDLIISCTVLEHVHDNARAMANLARGLAPGGVMAHYQPCRNAPFALANLLFGNRCARKLLFALFPERRNTAGFVAYYDRCTPAELRALCRQNGLQDVRIIPYYGSRYLAFAAPLHLVDVLRQLTLKFCRLEFAAEAFTIIARKPAVRQSATLAA